MVNSKLGKFNWAKQNFKRICKEEKVRVCVLTCSWWAYKYSNSLHQQHQANGAGELLCPYNSHKNLKLECPHHSIRHAKEYTEDHQSQIVVSLQEINGKIMKVTFLQRKE